MVLLIDAYNILKQIFHDTFISEQQRSAFIHDLGVYAKKKQHKAIAVFDGGPLDRPTQEKQSGVYVVYAGALESADDYIKQYMKKHKDLDILLVSSDADLCKAAGSLHIEFLHSLEFYKIMQNVLQARDETSQHIRQKAVKTSKVKDEELDRLMLEGSRVVPYKVEDFLHENNSRKSKPRTLPKKERQKLKKIKKL